MSAKEKKIIVLPWAQSSYCRHLETQQLSDKSHHLPLISDFEISVCTLNVLFSRRLLHLDKASFLCASLSLRDLPLVSCLV